MVLKVSWPRSRKRRLQAYLPSDQIKLSFEEGMLFRRLALLLEGKAPAAALFNGPYDFA